MKVEEAIKILQVSKAEIEWSAPLDYQDAFNIAIEALKKQIPVKPLRRRTTFDRSINKLYCPVCKKYLGYENYRTRSVSNQSGDYCDCGQKISWWR